MTLDKQNFRIVNLRMTEELYQRLIAQTSRDLSLRFQDRVSLNTVIIKMIERGLEK